MVGAALLPLGHIAGLGAGPLGGHISDRNRQNTGDVDGRACVGSHYLLTGSGDTLVATAYRAAVDGHLACTSPCRLRESYVISNVLLKTAPLSSGIYYFASRGGPAILLPIIGDLIDKFSFSTALPHWVSGFLPHPFCTGLLWGTKE